MVVSMDVVDQSPSSAEDDRYEQVEIEALEVGKDP
jgi:hypothetical protein